MKTALFFITLFLSLSIFASEKHDHQYPFPESVSQLIEKTNETQNPNFFGKAAGRCAAMFRSMHVLLAEDDPTQPHPTLEKYYGHLIDVYREIAALSTPGLDLSTKELPEKLVKDAALYLNTYYYWMSWNKQISGDYIEHSPIMKRELNDCESVLTLSGLV